MKGKHSHNYGNNYHHADFLAGSAESEPSVKAQPEFAVRVDIMAKLGALSMYPIHNVLIYKIGYLDVCYTIILNTGR